MTCLVQKVVVLRRDDTAADDEDVRPTHLLEAAGQLRHERLVAGGERGDPDDVNVAVDRLLGHFLGSLEIHNHTTQIILNG